MLTPHKDFLQLYINCLIEVGLLRIVIKNIKYNLT